MNYSTNGKPERNPVIMFKDKILIDPATIINEEYNKKIKDANHKISLYNSVKKILANK